MSRRRNPFTISSPLLTIVHFRKFVPSLARKGHALPSAPLICVVGVLVPNARILLVLVSTLRVNALVLGSRHPLMIRGVRDSKARFLIHLALDLGMALDPLHMFSEIWRWSRYS